jgi:hypothetical protein
MTKKHFIDFANLIADLYNSSNTKNEIYIANMVQNQIINICYAHGKNFCSYTFRNYIEDKLDSKRKTLLKRFKVGI